MKVLNGLGGFLKNKKKEAKGIPPASHDQPERRSIIWIDIFTLFIQDRDIDPYKEPSGLAVIHHGLLGSIPRWESDEYILDDKQPSIRDYCVGRTLR